MRTKLSLVAAVAIVWILVGLPISTVRAAQPSFLLGGCFNIVDFPFFLEAVEDLTLACETTFPDADRLLLTMCFPSGPPEAAGPQASCPPCDLSTQWAVSCSELSTGAP